MNLLHIYRFIVHGDNLSSLLIIFLQLEKFGIRLRINCSHMDTSSQLRFLLDYNIDSANLCYRYKNQIYKNV